MFKLNEDVLALAFWTYPAASTPAPGLQHSFKKSWFIINVSSIALSLRL